MNDLSVTTKEVLSNIKPRMRELCINFTSRCKLRCVYCSAGKEGYVGFDATPETIETLIEFIRDNKVKSVVVGFYGDTLESESWAAPVARILDLGVVCRIHSALYRKLKPEEVDVLSRFDTIGTSVDTPDRETLAKVRKGLDIRTLLYNMHTIRRTALSVGKQPPKFDWTCVLTDAVVFELPDLVAFAASNTVAVIHLSDLGKFEAFESGLKSVFDMSDEKFLEALQAVERARVLAGQLGILLDGQVLDLMREHADGQMAQTKEHDTWINNADGKLYMTAQKLQTGQTRLCIKPWDNVSVLPQGDVYPCCAYSAPFGRISSEQSLEDIFTNENFEQLRAQLASGKNLSSHCENCFNTPAVTPEKLRDSLYVATSTPKPENSAGNPAKVAADLTSCLKGEQRQHNGSNSTLDNNMSQEKGLNIGGVYRIKRKSTIQPEDASNKSTIMWKRWVLGIISGLGYTVCKVPRNPKI